MNEMIENQKAKRKVTDYWKKIPKSVKKVGLIILCTIIGLGVIANYFNKEEESGVYISNYLRGISELSTVEHSYTFIGEFDNSRNLDLFVTKLDVPFTNKHFIGVFNGIIKYGIDISKMSEAVIDNSKKVITINMPEIIRTNHNVIDDSIKYFDEDNNILNPISVKDGDSFRIEHKREAEKQDIDNGVISYVHTETEKCVKMIVTNTFSKYKDYEVRCIFPNQEDIKDGELPKF